MANILNIFKKRNLYGKKVGWYILLIFLVMIVAGIFAYPKIWDKPADWLNNKFKLSLGHFWNVPFKLGLDLQGGTSLIYEADLSQIEPKEYANAMSGVRDVIERRVNMFGVTEPVVQVNKTDKSWRLIVELAGVRDVGQAIEMIGQTPTLDFREQRDEAETKIMIDEINALVEKQKSEQTLTQEEIIKILQDPYFKPTTLSGRYLKNAQLIFDQQTFQPKVDLIFNDEGAKLFEEITGRNVGKLVAIYLDGQPISTPKVNEKIAGGRAEISGDFTNEEAKQLVQRLNAGALPVPIKLISQQTIGASLGKESLDRSLKAGILGFLAVIIFMLFYYRLTGLLSGLSLVFYLVIVLSIFKLGGITLTLAGIAGFILSLGMAVDANVLIFERMKEELRQGKSLGQAIEEGYHRAWSAIRDGNLTTLLICLILFVFATGTIKGFALTLGIGVLISMFSAITITHLFLNFFVGGKLENINWFWRGKK